MLVKYNAFILDKMYSMSFDMIKRLDLNISEKSTYSKANLKKLLFLSPWDSKSQERRFKDLRKGKENGINIRTD